MEEPNFSAGMNIGHSPEIKNNTPTLSSLSQVRDFNFYFLITIILIFGVFSYFVYNGYFQTNINQTQSVEPIIEVNTPDISNNYDIKNDHTIVKNLSLKVWDEGNEVEVELE